MSGQTYSVIRKQIVKAKNMAHARMVAEGYNDYPGQVLHDDCKIIESDIEEIWDEEEQEAEIVLNSNEAKAEDQSIFLRSENRRLAKSVEKNKNIKDEAVYAIYEAAYSAFSSVDTAPIKSPIIKHLPGAPETAVAVFADWQLGKITPDYSSEVLAERIEIYTQKLLEITEIQRKHHPVKNLHVWLLGDIVEGEEIFPGQSHLIDSGLYRQVGINGPAILMKFFDTVLQHFEHIHVTGVIGNHGAVGGRGRKQHDPETNMDRLLYKSMEIFYKEGRKEPRITFNIPDGRGERHWYAIDTIGSYNSLLIHGDQMPAPGQYHGYYKRAMGWKDGAIPEDFEDIFMGHYHQQFKMTIGSSILRVSGSPESYNTYAQEYFSSMSRPCQHLMFVHPENGVTCEYSIWLDGV
ncbi:hypothetical protein [Flavobacterium sp.]|jgi:hypothetical protein|uniref:hypothetical protein n=1 Tax=Flavobacterium sp. TaxID=239 RepID=UPI003BC6A7CE